VRRRRPVPSLRQLRGRRPPFLDLRGLSAIIKIGQRVRQGAVMPFDLVQARLIVVLAENFEALELPLAQQAFR
jgi:hypothetical protein